MKVLFLTKYGMRGASSRCRSYQYFPLLEKRGIRCTTSPLFSDVYLEERYRRGYPFPIPVVKGYLRRLFASVRCVRYDLVVIENELFPWMPAFGEKLLDLCSVPYVVDYDDAIFHKYDMHRSAFVRTVLGQKIDSVMRGAAMVIAGNEYLAARAGNAGAKRVELLPTVVDLERYIPKSRGSNRVFTIGWIGTPVTEKYLTIARTALAEVCREGKGKVVLVGARTTKWDGIPVEIHPWSESTEVSEIQQFDVGIMPLPDTPWERGKCGYKLIQYMATAVPGVASPVGVNRQIVENGVNGYLATTTEEWVRSLSILRDDKQLGDVMGERGRKTIEQRYSLSAAAERFSILLQSAAKESR